MHPRNSGYEPERPVLDSPRQEMVADGGIEPPQPAYETSLSAKISAMVVAVGVEPTRLLSSTGSPAFIRRGRSPELTTDNRIRRNATSAGQTDRPDPSRSVRNWSEGGDSNPRQSRWQRDILPLNYPRELVDRIGNAPITRCLQGSAVPLYPALVASTLLYGMRLNHNTK